MLNPSVVTVRQPVLNCSSSKLPPSHITRENGPKLVLLFAFDAGSREHRLPHSYLALSRIQTSEREDGANVY